MKDIKKFLVLLAAMTVVSSTALADEFRSPEDSAAETVVSGMANKAARGTANLVTGIWELPKQIYLTANEDGAAQAVSIGPFKGIWMTVARTLAGAVELATFFIPFPGFYDPLIEPSYVWQTE